MPNGGSDNCGCCAFNRVVREDLGREDPQALWTRSHCLLRDLRITDPMWTCCANCDHGVPDGFRNDLHTPRGWILASGVFEGGYTRIPRDDHREPVNQVPATCILCGRQVEDGLELSREGEVLGFCCNRHYVQWWRTCHDDAAWDPGRYDEPHPK